MLDTHLGAGGRRCAGPGQLPLSSAEVGYILRHSGARYLLLAAELEPLAAPLELAGVTVIHCADGWTSGCRRTPPDGIFMA